MNESRSLPAPVWYPGTRAGLLTFRPRGLQRLRMWGFSLLELLVVMSIIAVATAGVSLSMRDSAQATLEQEGKRLAALLESGRARSRSSGVVMQWVVADGGFRFQGPNPGDLSRQWLHPQTSVLWPDGQPRMLVLGPDPIIPPQSLTLVLEGNSLALSTDGLQPFVLRTVQP